MQLYSRAISPFSARVRVSILAKGLPIHIIDDPDVRSAEYARLNPQRRVPVLQLDDGLAIPESDTIVEYLEDAFPEVPLRPSEPEARARVRLVARSAELYVFPACLPIFGARAAGDREQLDTLFSTLDQALARLALTLSPDGDWHAWGSQLSTADGALAAFLFYAQVVGAACDRAPLTPHPRLQQFWQHAQSDAILSKVIGEMGAAMAARRAQS